MKKYYTTPETIMLKLHTDHHLLAGSFSENIGDAKDQNEGSFGSRGRGKFWDDDEE